MSHTAGICSIKPGDKTNVIGFYDPAWPAAFTEAQLGIEGFRKRNVIHAGMGNCPGEWNNREITLIPCRVPSG
jgi:hypothetical protein